ncbi:MAG: putative Ig domain-containing protein [Terracidiphilus sp.]|nr:putative Ig domain-containing protein [Terracidiphilus sp.]
MLLSHKKLLRALLMLSIALATLFAAMAPAQTTATVTPVAYAQPSNGVLQAGDGNFYAPSLPIFETCIGDATHLCSYIFQMTPSGATSIFAAFDPIPTNATAVNTYGIEPSALIVGADGNLYGACLAGGTGSFGTIFKVDIATKSITVLKSFGVTGNALDPGYQPNSLIQASDGSFYFTSGLGVYQLTTAGAVNTIYTFPFDTSTQTFPKGGTPTSVVQGNDGYLYVTLNTGPQTVQGGSPQGAIVQLTLDGQLTNLHTFAASGNEGNLPLGPLTEGPDGNFYGVTQFSLNAPATSGYAFKITPGGVFTIIHSFSEYVGNRNGALLLGSDGNFYGATVEGGDTSSANCSPIGCGTLYQMAPSGTYTTLHTFEGGAPPDLNNLPIPPTVDGASPTAPLVQVSGGNFYATTSGNASSIPIVDQISLSPAVPSPIQLTFNPTEVIADNPTTLTWKVLNAFSLTAQLCTASVVGSPKGSGTWSGLQPGVLANGVFGGASTITPTAGGPYTYALTCGGKESAFATLVVHGTSPLQISTTALPNPVVNQPYSAYMMATGGINPYTWTVSGTLPKGLTFDPVLGQLQGTPLQYGTYPLAFGVKDSTTNPEPLTDAIGLIVTVDSGLQLSPILPNPQIGKAYSQALNATGGLKPYTWKLTSGTLPDGLQFNATSGVISGTPTTAGAFTFTITVADAENPKATAPVTFTLSTAAPGLSVTTPGVLPAAGVGNPYTMSLSATGGTPPYTWTASGAVPAGLTLSTSGTIAGTPTQYSVPAGTSNIFSVTVTDSSNPQMTAPATMSLAVNRTLKITLDSLPTGRVGVVTNIPLTVTGGIPPYTWFAASSPLPNTIGVYVDGTVLEYDPILATDVTINLQVQDSESIHDTAESAYITKFLPALLLTTTSLASSNTAGATGENITFTATVTPASGVTPTGIVNFYNGTTSLGTAPVDTNGNAVLQTSFATAGVYSVTAAYSGDGTYAASTSTALTETVVTPGITATATPATLTIKSGSSGQLVITMTPVGGYTGPITFTCGTLPAHVSCSFAPPTLTIDGSGGPFTDTLTVNTDANKTAMLAAPGSGRQDNGLLYASLFLFPGSLAALLGLTRRKQNGAAPHALKFWLIVILLLAGVAGLSSCGGTSSTARPGTYTIPISISTAGGTSQSINATIVVD